MNFRWTESRQLVVLQVVVLFALGVLSAKPVKLILDTDVAVDAGDPAAITFLHGLADRCEVEILGITCITTNKYAAGCVDAIDRWHGRPDIPVGILKGEAFLDGDSYTKYISENWENRYPAGSDAAPDATVLLRQLLAKEPDDSQVVMVCIGPLRNLSNLLNSAADAASPLNGHDLVAKKVKLLSSMAAVFGATNGWGAGITPGVSTEFNIEKDVAAAQNVTGNWPTPIVFSGLEVGMKIVADAGIIRNSGNGPTAYALNSQGGERPAWDQTSILYGVRGRSNIWNLDSGGTCRINGNATNTWIRSPGAKDAFLIAAKSDSEIAVLIDSVQAQAGHLGGCKDTSRPSTPSNVSAHCTASGTVVVSWSPSIDPQSGIETYGICRNSRLIGSLSGATAFEDRSVVEFTKYNYWVSAANGVGWDSDRSPPVEITTTADKTPPSLAAVAAIGETADAKLYLCFSEPVDPQSASVVGNYSISGGITVAAAAVSASDPRLVELTVRGLMADVQQTVTVSMISDRAKSPNTIGVNNNAAFAFKPYLQGLRYRYVELDNAGANALKAGVLPAVKTGIVAKFDISPRLRDNTMGFAFAGMIKVPSDGQYTFFTKTASDDGSILRIDNSVVVDNNGEQSKPEEASGTMQLTKGIHSIAAYYWNQWTGFDFVVSWEGPGVARQEIPASVLLYAQDTTIFPPEIPAGGQYTGDVAENRTALKGDRADRMHIVRIGTGFALRTVPQAFPGGAILEFRVYNMRGEVVLASGKTVIRKGQAIVPVLCGRTGDMVSTGRYFCRIESSAAVRVFPVTLIQ
jgi:inosine-uridine nucleoside N-ribohydrolase